MKRFNRVFQALCIVQMFIMLIRLLYSTFLFGVLTPILLEVSIKYIYIVFINIFIPVNSCSTSPTALPCPGAIVL